MEKEEKIVRACFDLWGEGVTGVIKSYHQYHHPDFVWWNSARGSVSGIEACIEGMRMMDKLTGFSACKVPIRHLVVLDKVVYVERSDDLFRADGSLIQSVPVFGVIEFKGDKISSWRDYCDDWMRNFRPQSAPKALA